MAKITREQRRSLHEALVAAFPRESELRQLTQFALDSPLEPITTADGLNAKVLAVMAWAESRGCLDPLLKGAYRINPGCPALVAFLRSLQEGWSFDQMEG